jgi:hypothetical protein
MPEGERICRNLAERQRGSVTWMTGITYPALDATLLHQEHCCTGTWEEWITSRMAVGAIRMAAYFVEVTR